MFATDGTANQPLSIFIQLGGPDSYAVKPGDRRFETWEFGWSSLVGLGAAVDYALDLGLADIESRVFELAARLRRTLAEIPGVTTTDVGARLCGIVTFTVSGLKAEELVRRMRTEQINLSVSTPDSTPIDAARRGLPDLVRASVHYFNTDDELDRFGAALLALQR